MNRLNDLPGNSFPSDGDQCRLEAQEMVRQVMNVGERLGEAHALAALADFLGRLDGAICLRGPDKPGWILCAEFLGRLGKMLRQKSVDKLTKLDANVFEGIPPDVMAQVQATVQAEMDKGATFSTDVLIDLLDKVRTATQVERDDPKLNSMEG